MEPRNCDVICVTETKLYKSKKTIVIYYQITYKIMIF
jgi:hypothetical protein